MTRILVTYEVRDNTTDVNIVSLKDMFILMGVSYKFMKSSIVNSSDIECSDIILAIRPNSIFSYKIAKVAKKTGRYYILLIDDDIINLNKNHPDYWKRKYTISCIEYGNAILTPNPYIQKDYSSKYNLKPILVNAHVNESDIKPKHVVGKKIKLIYPAGKDHAEVFNKYLSPVIKKFINQYKDTLDITFVGVKPDLGEHENVHYLNNMAYSEYLNFMQRESFDIGLAPLEDTQFCHKKYFVKYIEYSKYGMLGLYSNVYPYIFAVTNNQNGILVNNSIEAWENNIKKVLENTSDIERIVENAQSDLRNKYSIKTVTRDFVSQCPEIESFNAPEVPVKYGISVLSIALFRVTDIVVKVVYRLLPTKIKNSSLFS